MVQRIRLEHGSGGALSRDLVESLIYPALKNVFYQTLSDATEFPGKPSMYMTTDTYVVDPVFFPGGDIGKLAVFGTCNDLAVSGAMPLFVSLGFVLEEGFLIEDLKKILRSIQDSAKEANVQILTGDTKVVPRGRGGGIFINSTGVGERAFSGELTASRLKPGDSIVLSGALGRHGITVLAARESLPVPSSLQTDCTFLFPLCESLFPLGDDVRFLRDATRGGVAAVLNEAVAAAGSSGALVYEKTLPIDVDVAATCNILGLNPLEIANEGVFLAIVAEGRGEDAVSALRSFAAGKSATIIGEITKDHAGRVILETKIGGRRILDMPRGLLLPRIC